MKVEINISEDMLTEIVTAELTDLRGFYESELKAAYLTQEDKREIRRDIKAISAVLRMYGT